MPVRAAKGPFYVFPEYRDRMPYVVQLRGTFAEFYTHLDTDVAEPLLRYPNGIVVVGDEEARMKMRPVNPWLRGNRGLLGTLLLTADDFGPLSPGMVKEIRKYLINDDGGSTAIHGILEDVHAVTRLPLVGLVTRCGVSVRAMKEQHDVELRMALGVNEVTCQKCLRMIDRANERKTR